jgi:uncharacterized membrane protein YeaQ/YmgE (transglycosylase-associated protein family)
VHQKEIKEKIMSILIWIISGIVAGWLAGLIVRGDGFGLLGDLIVGLIGGLIGGWLAGRLGIHPGTWLGQVLVAAAGGVIFVVLLRAIRRM